MEKYLTLFFFLSSKIIPIIPANRTPSQQAAAASNLYNPNFRRKEIDNSPQRVGRVGHQSRLVSNITCHSYSDNNNNKNIFLVEFGEISFNNS